MTRLKLFVFLILALTIVGTGQSHACQSNGEVCSDILWCLKDGSVDPNDRQHLSDAVKGDIWSEIGAWTEKCQSSRRHGDSYENWNTAKAQCSDADWVNMGREAKKHLDAGHDKCAGDVSIAYCYTQGNYYKLGNVGPGGFGSGGVCEGPTTDGAPCHCGDSPGTVRKR
jgi:hypothetical protein